MLNHLKAIATSAILAGALLISGVVIPAPFLQGDALAVGACPNQKDGKCPKPRKISKSRSDFTPEQRKMLLEEARKICKKQYGATSRVHYLDYKKWTIICTEPGFD